MIYFRELVTFFSLLAWIEMTTTVMNGNDCFRNGNDCSKWQRPFTKGKTASPTRMKRLWRQRPFLETVFQTTPTRRCHLLQHANQDQINALSELVLNLLKRRIPLTPPLMARLRRYKPLLRDVGKRPHSTKHRRELLMSQVGRGLWTDLKEACQCVLPLRKL